MIFKPSARKKRPTSGSRRAPPDVAATNLEQSQRYLADAFHAEVERGAKQVLTPGLFARHLGQDAGTNDLQHTGHRGEDRRAHLQHIRRQMFDPAGIDDLGADTGKEELAHRMFVAVRKREIGQVDLILQVQRADQFERTLMSSGGC
jgi:hypothetical protein